MPVVLPALVAAASLAPVLLAEFDPWFEDFRRTPEIDQRLDELADLSSMASVAEIGTSIEGRSIRALTIGHGGDDRPTLVAIGTQHAREWISPMVTTCLADALVRGWADDDPEVMGFLELIDVIIVPVVNPDGYEYSWDFDRFWRKNRRPGGGVDLNRNWAASWGTGVAGEPPSSPIFPGSAPFSEPETDAVRMLVESHNVVGFLDYHSPIALVLYPFAYTSDPGPEEDVESGWAEQMAAAISSVHGVPHGSGKPGVGNPSGGLAQDWAHGEQQALAWTVELRGGDFVLPADEIVPACEENFAGFVVIAQNLADEFGEPPPMGGDTEGLDTTAGDSGAGTTGAPATTGAGPGGGGDAQPGTTSTNGDGSTGSTDSTPASDDGSDAGCGCRAPQGAGGSGGWWLVGLPLAWRRRRPARGERAGRRHPNPDPGVRRIGYRF